MLRPPESDRLSFQGQIPPLVLHVMRFGARRHPKIRFLSIQVASYCKKCNQNSLTMANRQYTTRDELTSNRSTYFSAIDKAHCELRLRFLWRPTYKFSISKAVNSSAVSKWTAINHHIINVVTGVQTDREYFFMHYTMHIALRVKTKE